MVFLVGDERMTLLLTAPAIKIWQGHVEQFGSFGLAHPLVVKSQHDILLKMRQTIRAMSPIQHDWRSG